MKFEKNQPNRLKAGKNFQIWAPMSLITEMEGLKLTQNQYGAGNKLAFWSIYHLQIIVDQFKWALTFCPANFLTKLASIYKMDHVFC